MKTTTLNGVRYQFNATPVDGYIESPDMDDDNSRTLYVDRRLLGRRVHLWTAIHEAFHALFPGNTKGKPHDDLENKAKDLARFLWNLGYRYEVKDD